MLTLIWGPVIRMKRICRTIMAVRFGGMEHRWGIVAAAAQLSRLILANA